MSIDTTKSPRRSHHGRLVGYRRRHCLRPGRRRHRVALLARRVYRTQALADELGDRAIGQGRRHCRKVLVLAAQRLLITADLPTPAEKPRHETLTPRCGWLPSGSAA